MYFLNFKVGTNNFALPMEQVSEVSAMVELTKVSLNLPSYFLGVMCLRDETMSVLDLRVKLNLEGLFTDKTGIIICKLNGIKIGLVVDYIFDVINYGESEIKLPPVFAGQISSFVKNVVYKNKQLMLILDINSLIKSEEIGSMISHIASH